MSEHSDQSPAAESVVDNPRTSSAQSNSTAPRLFARERSVHDILGGGKYADVLMWKKKHVTGGVLLGAAAAYLLFEFAGYTFLSIFSNALLLLVAILFLWSTAAALLNRSPPPIPEVQLSEDMVENIAQTLRIHLNRGLGTVHVIALGKDYKLFLEVLASLWFLSIVGGWVDFLTLIYIGVLMAHTLPVLYDKHQEEIDKYMKLVVDETRRRSRSLDDKVLSKIPRAKKVQ